MKTALTIPGANPESKPTTIQVPSGIPTGERAFQDGLNLFIQLLFIGAILLALGFLIWAGIRMIMFGGKKEDIAKVRSMLGDIILGLTLVFMAFLIIRVFAYFFGIEFFE